MVSPAGGEGVKLPWSGTFHHIGFRILRKYAPLIGYKNNFTILDSEDSVDLMKLCLKQEGIDRKERRFPSASVMHNIMSYARNAETTIEDVLDLKHPKWLEIADVIGRIADEYARRKREANAMDFDDLLVNTYLLLLKEQSVRKKYSEQFRYVLVDEYQDTNKIQASLIRLFASHHKNVLVVGDDAQSIYSFRAADIQNILSFEDEYPGAKIFRLETNYRSTPDILDVANDVIANNKAQYRKELKSVREAFTKPEAHAFADQNEEAVFIAERILELRDEGVPLNHIAALFRAAFHSQALELELNKRDIPYDYRGGVRFFERAHIKDVLAYLRIFHNLADAIAWSRVLNMQVGIGPAGAQRIVEEIKVLSAHHEPHPDPLLDHTKWGDGEGSDANSSPSPTRSGEMGEVGRGSGNAPDIVHLGSLLSARGQMGWNDFLQIWDKMWRSEMKSPVELIEAVINSKYAEYLENEYPDYRERLQDLEQLARFSERQPDLQQFLAEASLQESYSARQARRATTFDDNERVVLSTIHQAKGLEWEAVFIMNLAAGQFPNDRALSERQGIEEERRLFYVAVTRAKKHLYLTYPLVGSFESLLSGPSLFLEEISRDLLEEISLQGDTAFTDQSDAVDGITYVREDEPFHDSSFGQKKRKGFLREIDEL